jgi:hypothetical protein
VDLSFYKSYISEEIRDEGREEGRAEGEARRAAEDVPEVLDVRGIDVPAAVRERIVSCRDPETLRRRHRRAVIAPSAEQIFLGGAGRVGDGGCGYEWPSSSVSSSAATGTEPESEAGRRGNGSTRVSSMTGGAGWGGLGMTAASEWPPQP